MDFKMPKSQEQSEQLQDKELEAIAGGRLNDLVKNLSLRGKVARWAAVAASVVGISVSMAMPAEAINRVDNCNDQNFFTIFQGSKDNVTMCFANAGDAKVNIANVHQVSSGNNAGYIITNKGRLNFEKQTTFDFMNNAGPLTLLRIVIR
jgi:hypothetical protein